MLNKHPFMLFLVVLLVVSLACAQPGAAPAQDPNAVNTSIAQSIAARQTEAALANPPTATFTASPIPPTETATETPLPSPTATLSPPMITMSVDTNCRTGPGSLFEKVGVVHKDQSTIVVGREPKGEFWYVQNPDRPGEFCWLWGEYGEFSGNTLAIISMPVPTSAVSSYSVTFDSLQKCSAWWVNFKLVNKTDAVFQSMTMVMTDTKKPATVNLNSNDFSKSVGCEPPVNQGSLGANGTIVVSSLPLNYSPKGNAMTAKFTLCLDKNMGGTCLSQEIQFTP